MARPPGRRPNDDEDVDPFGLDDSEDPQPEDMTGDDDSEDTLPCPRCGAMIWENAERCGRCGAWVKPGSARGWPEWWRIGIAILLVLAVILLSTWLI
ncbi:MAG: hypothetical protein IPM64_08005 [Phycisphaerales bacterium]|nr:hypothetical protein [Phycisphaerales bacterium]